MSANSPERNRWERLFQLAGLITGVVAIVVTVFFSIRSESTKELTVTYTPKRSLVARDTSTNARLEVRLGEIRIAAPWLVSGKIENTGNRPIEERDIEEPLRLSFSGGHVISAEIAQKSQRALFASAAASGNDVVITHKLLNPGDWIGFDVIFDGEPAMPPDLSFRISGISHPKQIVGTSVEPKRSVASIPLPAPVVYLVLTIASLVACILGAGGVIAIGAEVRKLFVPKRAAGAETSRVSSPLPPYLSPDNIAARLEPRSRVASIALTALGGKVDLRWLDNPELLRSQMELNLPPGLLNALDSDANGAAQLLARELREDLRRRLAGGLYTFLPRGLDEAARQEIDHIDVDTATTQALFDRAASIAASASLQSKSEVDAEALGIGAVFLIAGFSLVAVVGWMWRIVLLF